MSIVAIIPISGTDPEFSEGPDPAPGGRSLIEATARAARSSERIDRVEITTDNKAVAERCEAYGAPRCILRPPELANPRAPITQVLGHALACMRDEEGYVPDWVVMLMITHPFRPDGFIDGFIGTVLSQGLDSAFAATEETSSHWFINTDGQPELVAFGNDTAKSQKRPFYRELSGLISMARGEIVAGGSLYGTNLGIVPIGDAWAALNVHDAVGWELAELLAPRFLGSD